MRQSQSIKVYLPVRPRPLRANIRRPRRIRAFRETNSDVGTDNKQTIQEVADRVFDDSREEISDDI
jgi:hypothetical protein